MLQNTMVKNLKKEKAILADQTHSKRADLSHVQLYADFFAPVSRSHK